jgi:hypothetical protein
MHFCMKRLRILKFFQKFKIKIKNQKPIAVDVLFNAFSTRLIQSGRAVPLKVLSSHLNWGARLDSFDRL